MRQSVAERRALRDLTQMQRGTSELSENRWAGVSAAQQSSRAYESLSESARPSSRQSTSTTAGSEEHSGVASRGAQPISAVDQTEIEQQQHRTQQQSAIATPGNSSLLTRRFRARPRSERCCRACDNSLIGPACTRAHHSACALPLLPAPRLRASVAVCWLAAGSCFWLAASSTRLIVHDGEEVCTQLQ